jgi:hypothetical protein
MPTQTVAAKQQVKRTARRRQLASRHFIEPSYAGSSCSAGEKKS